MTEIMLEIARDTYHGDGDGDDDGCCGVRHTQYIIVVTLLHGLPRINKQRYV